MLSKLRGPLPVLATTFVLVAPGVAGAADANDVARDYVRANPPHFGVSAGDVAELGVTSSYATKGLGLTHVNLHQRHRGLEVFGGHATVNVRPDGTVAFARGSLVKGVDADGSASAGLDAVAAVESAADALSLEEPVGVRVLRQSSSRARETTLSDGGISDEPIQARLGWQPAEGGLRLAWQMVIDDSSDSHLWNATIDARTGSLLDLDDWTTHDDVDELAQTLQRGSDGAPATATTPTLMTPNPVNDGSSYRVFAWPNESPNDALRTLVENPADAKASPHGWHDTNGTAGPEHTTTQGNNVHAYMDQDSNNAPDVGSSPSGGPGLDFEFAADLNEHAQNYRDAVVANLFYSNNMIHDVLHGFGFTEAAGNFQANNYDRGGGSGDYVRAEAADGGGTNNANFSTPAGDPGTGVPRMQMYLWPGAQFGPPNVVSVAGGATYTAGWSRFTPAPTSAGLPGSTFVYGGTSCAPATYPSPLPSGSWIAVVDAASACTNLVRVQVAETLGARGVVVVNTAAGNTPPVLTGSMTGPPVGIPAASLTQTDGAALKAAIAEGQTTGNLAKNPAHPGIRDGDFDNGIIIHEYGHGVSLRLTGGPGVNCLGGNEQAGEGWSDFLAIALMLDPALDDPESTRGLVPYALFQPNRSGNGLRPRPYSRTMELQPFTYDSIKTGGWINGGSLALPHGLGHGWAAVLWDMTWDLIDKHGHNPNLYASWETGGNLRAIQYVMDGLKLQACNPGLVNARDAIITATEERGGGADTCTVWASFARRGLGFSAAQGTTNRNDNTEAFDTHPDCHRGFRAPIAAQPELNDVDAGDVVALRFTADDGYRGLDLLTKTSPYSRQVDCTTLQTVTPGQTTITPRPFPVAARTPGNTKLTINANGVFHFNWKSDEAWEGTCREFVMTTKTGTQHRSYFRFI